MRSWITKLAKDTIIIITGVLRKLTIATTRIITTIKQFKVRNLILITTKLVRRRRKIFYFGIERKLKILN